MLEKIQKVYLLPSAKGVLGLILHTTRQELRILKEFKVALIENHHLIFSSMVTHLFNTYIPKTQLNLVKSSMFSLETECKKLDKLVIVHRKLINFNSTVVGNLQRDMKK